VVVVVPSPLSVVVVVLDGSTGGFTTVVLEGGLTIVVDGACAGVFTVTLGGLLTTVGGLLTIGWAAEPES